MKKRLIPHLLALVLLTGISEGAVTGQWDFDAGDLRATIGATLDFVDGSSGATSNGTSFGTTANFKISAVAGTRYFLWRAVTHSPLDFSRRRQVHGCAPAALRNHLLTRAAPPTAEVPRDLTSLPARLTLSPSHRYKTTPKRMRSSGLSRGFWGAGIGQSNPESATLADL